jgi:hypothetical protein
MAGVLAGDRGRSGRQGLPQRLATGSMKRKKQQEGEHSATHG